MKPKYSISIIVATLLFILAGCGTISISGEKGMVNLYNLTPKSTFADDLPHVDWKLVVAEPVATGGLDSKRIALRPNLKYLMPVNWFSIRSSLPIRQQMRVVAHFKHMVAWSKAELFKSEPQ